ncbi:MAG: DUF6978 family protein [Vicinamibacteria bacterium]
MLTQAEADSLIVMRKRFVAPRTISIPPGADETHDLVGDDPHEHFMLDLWRGTLRLTKYKMQTRARKVFVLVRLDIDGAPHTNPDGQKLGGTHIHVYREGYEARWAYPIAASNFQNTADARTVFVDFCRFCHIEDPPPFQDMLT